MTPEEKAAIIGYWRMGATWIEIVGITGYPEWKIKQVVKQYQLLTSNQ